MNSDGYKTWETRTYCIREDVVQILTDGAPKPSSVPGRSNNPKSYIYNAILNRYVRINFFDLLHSLGQVSEYHNRLDLYVERNLAGELIYVRVG
jgi:hypothetical protein